MLRFQPQLIHFFHLKFGVWNFDATIVWTSASLEGLTLGFPF